MNIVRHKILMQSYETVQTGILSSDIFLSVEGKPVNVGLVSLETHEHVTEPVPLAIADIPFIVAKQPDDIDSETVILRNKTNAIAEALRIRFSNIYSGIVDYESCRNSSTPKHKRSELFFSLELSEVGEA